MSTRFLRDRLYGRTLLLLHLIALCFALTPSSARGQGIPDEVAESTRRTPGGAYEELFVPSIIPDKRSLVLNELLGSELIVNGSFESGFTGWTAVNGANPWYPWQTAAAGFSNFFMAPASPQHGTRVAYEGIAANAGGTFTLTQDVSIPGGINAVLSWKDRYQIDLDTFCNGVNCGTATYTVEIRNTSNVLLQTLYTTGTTADTLSDTGWQSHMINLSAYAGQTIRLRFATVVSVSYAGPGQLEVDAVSLITGPEMVYMRSTTGAPWGVNTNEAAMNAVFGAGNWYDLRYETAVPADVFAPHIKFVFMEGGDFIANEMETFLNANQALIENWVSNGGRLFLNAGPNEGNGMNLGFANTLLVYPSFSGAGTASIAAGQSGHPIFNTPYTPVGTSWTGNFFSHASITCPTGCSTLIVNGITQSVLSSKVHGSGLVLFGGMTTSNFHSPQPQSTNLLQNILYFLRNSSLNLNAAPSATGDNYSTDEDTPLTVPAAGVLGNDSDGENNPLTAILVDGPDNAQSFTLNANGSFSYSPNANYNGSDSFTYKANDGQADSNVVTVNITVNSVNDPPTLADVPANAIVPEEAPYAFTATASDIENSPLVFSLVSAPAGASIDPNTGAFSWTPTEAQGPGIYSFSVRVTDEDTAIDELPISIDVQEVNIAPALNGVPAAATINELAPYGFNASATDPDVPLQSLTFSLVGAPAGASIDSGSGAFSWTPSEAQGPGVYSFSVRVWDGVVNSDAATSLTVNEVNSAPTLSAIVNQTINEETLFGLGASATDADDPANVLTYSLDISPAGMSIDPNTGAISWTPTESDGPGDHTVKVRVNDNGTPALFHSVTFNIHVDEVNLHPDLAAIGNKIVDENTLLTFDANATDADLPANGLTFSLVSAPAGASIDSVSGVFSWTPSESQGGNPNSQHVFIVRVSDNGSPSLSDEEQITVTVNEVNAAPALNAIANQTIDEEVLFNIGASATDSDDPANVLTYSLDANPAGMSIDPVTGAISWTPSETDGPGDHPVTVRVADNGTPSLSHTTSFNVHVDEVNIAPVLDAVGNKIVDENTLLTFDANGSDVDLPANGLSFSLVSAPAGASIDPATGVFSWTPSEAQGGNPNSQYVFTVRITDDGTPALSDEEAITVTVNEVNSPPVLGNINNQTGVWGNQFSFTATAADPDIPANALTFSLIGAPSGAAINGSTGAFAWTPTMLQIGMHTFTVRVTDDGSPSMYDEQSVTINVGRRATTLVYTGDGSEQYSDQQALSALLTDSGGGALNGSSVAGKTVGFAIGTQNASDATDASGVAATDLILTQNPNLVYTVNSSFAGDAYYLPSSDSDAFDIVQEDARAFYTGSLFASTSCATCSSANVTLAATIKDITSADPPDPQIDPFPGDIRNAKVTFVNRDAGNAPIAGCANLPVGLVSLSDTTIGTANCNWAVNLGSQDSLDFAVGIVVSHYYSRNASTENTVVTVSKPIGTNFITGGGYLVLTESGGQYPGLDNLKSNFGFNVKYNSSGKNLQGRVNVIVRGSDGRVYQIKGNVMRTLSVNNANPNARKAVWSGKATLTDVTDPLNPVAISGNNTFQMEMTDRGEPGSSDSISITLWNDAGGLLHSSNWNGTRSIEQTLVGGNLVVR